MINGRKIAKVFKLNPRGFFQLIFIDLLRMETLFTLHKKLIITKFLGLSLQKRKYMGTIPWPTNGVVDSICCVYAVFCLDVL